MQKGMAERSQMAGNRRWRVPAAGLALFLLLLGWYTLTMSGHTYSSDEETLLAAGESVVDSGSFVISRNLPLIQAAGASGPDYSRFGPGQSLLAVPFIELGRGLGAATAGDDRIILRICLLLSPAIVTAGTGAILYAWALALGYSRHIALSVGLLYGLTSLAWPYSRTFFAEPLAALFLMLSAYGIRREERVWWVIAGLAAAGALATKFQAGIAVPVILGYALLVSWRTNLKDPLPAMAGRAGFAVLGMLVPLALLFLYNQRLFGGPLVVGYGDFLSGQVAANFAGDWTTGLYGLTISTGKGLLIFSPTILLGLIGMGLRVRQQWRESLLAVGVLAVHLAFYSRYSYWHGDGSWGPRYLVFAIPFLYLPAAGLLATLRERKWRLGRAAIPSLVVVSFAVQLMPVLVNFDTYINSSKAEQRYFDPLSSPIVGQARIWWQQADVWWGRAFPPSGVAVFKDGFSYSEGDRKKGELLPRWTHSDAVVQVVPETDSQIQVRMVVVDYRPPSLSRADFSLLVDNEPLEGVKRTDMTGQQVRWELTFQLTADQARRGPGLKLKTNTWNPSKTPDGTPRNEDLGVMMQALEVKQDGHSFQLLEALPVNPPPQSRYGFWLWFQDRGNYHLFDSWLWYIFAAGMPRRSIAILLATVALPAVACMVIGLRGILVGWRDSESGRGAGIG